jgi:hypothetical protein
VGIAKVDDVSKLAALKLNGCVIGRALYEGRLTLADSLAAALRGAVSDDSSNSEASVPGSLKGPHFQSIKKSSGATTP